MFMDNVDYDAWRDYLIRKLKEQGISEGLICELGCGTGSMTERLADAGFDMIGIDSSVDMLEVAQEKKYDSGHADILYLNQDMREFELYGTVRAVVSVCDCLNYITEEEDLLQVFRLVNNYLDPDGIFIFDMNTIAKYEAIGDSTIAENREDGSFIWDNVYDSEQQLNEYVLTLFLPERVKGSDSKRISESGEISGPKRMAETGTLSDGKNIVNTEPVSDEETDCDAEETWEDQDEVLYHKYEEIHLQKAYSLEQVKKLLAEAGMIFVDAVDCYTDMPVTAETERMTIIAREHGKSWED